MMASAVAFLCVLPVAGGLSPAKAPPSVAPAVHNQAPLLLSAAALPARGTAASAAKVRDGGSFKGTAAASDGGDDPGRMSAAADGAEPPKTATFATTVQEEDDDVADAMDGDPALSRTTYFAGELGYNGLSGFGINTGHRLTSHFVAEGGLGFGTNGWRLGGRARLNLMARPLTPFIGLGLTLESGRPAIVVKEGVATADSYAFGGPGIQAVAGLAYTARGGFMLLATLGYLHRFLSEQASASIYLKNDLSRATMASVFGSGPVASIALGYAF